MTIFRVVESVEASGHRVPTAQPAAGGTPAWSLTTVGPVEVHPGSHRGLGGTYSGSTSVREAVHKLLHPDRG